MSKLGSEIIILDKEECEKLLSVIDFFCKGKGPKIFYEKLIEMGILKLYDEIRNFVNKEE